MERICVATLDGRAHYSIVSRLTKAGLRFVTVVPGAPLQDCGVVVTTRMEEASFEGPTVTLESLDEDPGIVKAQVISAMLGGRGKVVLGIDPGVRLGLAGFYDRAEVVSSTFEAADALCEFTGRLLKKTPNTGMTVRIGDGDLELAESLANKISALVPAAKLELVDERGTSRGSYGTRRDQKAAARIAVRKGRSV